MKQLLSTIAAIICHCLCAPIMSAQSASSQSVGSIQGDFTVTELGAASYTMKIECPAPTGGHIPQIGLNYNSQSGYGFAGLKFNICGISAITTGPKSQYYDNQTHPLTYSSADAYFLDGRRLLLKSGEWGEDESCYEIDGDPYTTITFHGSYDEATQHCWFEVRTKDGTIHKYGQYDNSRLTYTNKKGEKKINAWYISTEIDALGYNIEYSYTQQNLVLYPKTITYGHNYRIDRESSPRVAVNTIKFIYEDLDSYIQEMTLEDQLGGINRCLSEISTYQNGNLHRKYDLTYITVLNSIYLKDVQVSNHLGESFPSTTFTWQKNQNSSPTITTPSIDLTSMLADYESEYGESIHQTTDFNGDGISDIIKIYERQLGQNGGMQNVRDGKYSVAIFLSNGANSYNNPIVYDKIGAIADLEYYHLDFLGTNILDMDGDGVPDIVIPTYVKPDEPFNSYVGIDVIFGKDIISGNTSDSAIKKYGYDYGYVDKNLLITSADFNNDGREELFIIGDKEAYNKHWCMIFYYEDGHFQCTGRTGLQLNAKPLRVFAGDMNNDTLSDIIIFHESSIQTPGYSILFNKCNTDLENVFDYKIGVSAINRSFNDKSLTPCDINGDGLTDFVSTSKKGFNVQKNKGDGTFESLYFTDILDTDSSDNDLIIPIDNNSDGKSDIVLLRNINDKTFLSYWLVNQGENLKLIKKSGLSDKDQTSGSRVSVGMFTNTGKAEIMNVGQNLFSGDKNFDKNQLLIYSFANAQHGNISKIHDGLSREVTINYKSFFKSQPILQQKRLRYGGVPLNVVHRAQSTCGSTVTASISHNYNDLLQELTGRGIIGFDLTSQTDEITGETSATVIAERGSTYVPTKVIQQKELGEFLSSAEISYGDISNSSSNQYYAPISKVTTDYDGNSISETYEYNDNGDITRTRCEYNTTFAYNECIFGDFISVNGMTKPQTITTILKQPTDKNEYQSVTKYEYNSNGLVSSKTEHYNTALALTTEYKYDAFGNIISDHKKGYNVTDIEHIYEYDPSGRYIIKEYQIPQERVISREFDSYGLLIKESDITDASNILSTTFDRNGWGEIKATHFPDGTNETRSVQYINGGSAYITRTNGPTGQVTYETRNGNGQLLETQSYGLFGVNITSKYAYDSKGNMTTATTVTGDRKEEITNTYDIRNRLLSKETTLNSLSFGPSYRYEYGNLQVDEYIRYSNDADEFKTTKTYDQLGNTISISTEDNSVYNLYNSMGNKAGIMTMDNIMQFKYDTAGNLIETSEMPNRTQYSAYSADHKMLSHTDYDGKCTSYNYNSLGRLDLMGLDDRVIIYCYGTSGYDRNRLTQSSDGYNTINYTHDKLGRVISESRIFANGRIFEYKYEYDDSSRLISKTYPNDVRIRYRYDAYGNQVGVYLADSLVNRVKSYTGMTTETEYAGGFTMEDVLFNRDLTLRKRVYDSAGNDISILWLRRNRQSGLLERRDGFHPDIDSELFTYDSHGRLIHAVSNRTDSLNMLYHPSGCIAYKSGVGKYHYDFSSPCAVQRVENYDNSIPAEMMETEYNSLGLIQRISDESTGYEMTFDYGPDQTRWEANLSYNGDLFRTILYAGEYEEIIEGGLTREYYYLDGGSVLMRVYYRDKQLIEKLLHLVTDNQNSIVKIIDTTGKIVFDAYYDPWGKQTILHDEVGLLRGYTSHEMLPEFNLINMDGRLYDPVIAQFLSPDNYIQQPDNPQCYNKYSYCLNNPLQYTDPTGELFGIDDLAIIGFGFWTGYLTNAIQTGEIGWSSIKAGLFNGFTSMLGFKFGGKSVELGKYLMGMGANAVTSTITKPITFSISPNLSISALPLVGFGSGGVTMGLGISVNAKFGDFEFGAGFGAANSYYAWNVAAKYQGYGAGFGRTYYEGGTFHGQTISNQTTGTFTAYYPKGSFAITNDLWGDGEDRWRTTSAELTIGKYSIGTYVDTNYGERDGGGRATVQEDGLQKTLAPSPVGANTNEGKSAWRNGEVYYAPIWIGIRNGNQIQRFGYSHYQVQNLTQNLVHKYFGNANFYTNYKTLRALPYFSISTPNPFSIWP